MTQLEHLHSSPVPAPRSRFCHPDGRKRPSRAPRSSFSSGKRPNFVRTPRAVLGFPGISRAAPRRPSVQLLAVLLLQAPVQVRGDERPARAHRLRRRPQRAAPRVAAPGVLPGGGGRAAPCEPGRHRERRRLRGARGPAARRHRGGGGARGRGRPEGGGGGGVPWPHDQQGRRPRPHAAAHRCGVRAACRVRDGGRGVFLIRSWLEMRGRA